MIAIYAYTQLYTCLDFNFRSPTQSPTAYTTLIPSNRPLQVMTSAHVTQSAIKWDSKYHFMVSFLRERERESRRTDRQTDRVSLSSMQICGSVITSTFLLPGNFDQQVRTYKDIFLYQSISLAASIAGVTPLRIAKPSFHMESGNAYFIATLLDRAPVLRKESSMARCFEKWLDLTQRLNQGHVRF